MTKKEAHLFLRHSAEDDLEEVWEQLLFTQKQYFLTHTPTPLVWKSKLKRLFKKYQAFLVLTDQEVSEEMTFKEPVNTIEFPDDFLLAFNVFHESRTQHKSEVLQANSFSALSEAIMRWLGTEIAYASYWSYPASEKLETKVFLSKEPDPMEVLKEIRAVQQRLDAPLIEELKKNYNNLPENIQKEVKRLTLLSKN